MPNSPQEPQNCWEFWDCPQEIRTNCLAYQQDLGKRCWSVPYSYGSLLKKDMEKCWECAWYKKVTHKE